MRKDMKEDDWKELVTQMQETQLDALPQREVLKESYTLSDSFSDRMDGLLKRMRRKRLYAKARSCALGAAAAGVLFGSVFYPRGITEAGRRVMTWLEDFAEFKFQEETSLNSVPEYMLSYVPDGFELQVDEYYETSGILAYFNENNRLCFDYVLADAEISLNNEGVDFSILKTGDNREIYYFEATDGFSDNCMMWLSEDEQIVFTITSMLPKEEMLKIREGVAQK